MYKNRNFCQRHVAVIRIDAGPPLFEHRRHQPPRQATRTVGHGRSINLRAQQLMSETKRTGDPISTLFVRRETYFPVEIRGTRFEGRGNITKAQRTPRAMTQPMKTK